jgi:glycine/D-amino acid oxidase-like deaminating enzyme
MDNTISAWKATANKTILYPSLQQNLEIDIVVIGAGITGISTASYLTEAGKKVAIIDADTVGSGTTGLSTGNLYIPVQPYYQTICEKFDLETAKTVAQARQFAIDQIEKNITEKNIECNFSRRPWYFYTNEENKIDFLNKEIETFKQMDLPCEYLTDLPLPLKYKKAAVMEQQARFHPLNYLQGMAAHLHQQGCLIYENTRVIEYEEKREFCIVKTDNGNIRAKKIIIATHTPIGFNLSQMFTAPYRSYIIAGAEQDQEYPEAHFWNLDHPFLSLCTHALNIDNKNKNNKPNMLMLAGSHHKIDQDKQAISHYTQLKFELQKLLPNVEVRYQWSAQHYQATDNIPYIGLASRFAKHTYIATGYFADGLTYGVLAGKLLSDRILQNTDRHRNTFRANRFTPFISAPFVLKENMNVFAQYLKSLITKKELDLTMTSTYCRPKLRGVITPNSQSARHP